MDWKKLGKRLLFPPVWLVGILTVFSAAALTYIFINGMERKPPAYPVYALAFYTLCVVTVFCVTVLPRKLAGLRRKLYEHPLGKRYMTDRVFRTKVSLHLALAVNLTYVGINLLSWHFSRSWWFVVLAVYYVIMSVMRFLLVRYVRLRKLGTSMRDEWKRARSCACILLLVNLSLSGAVLMILYRHRGYDYPGVMIYVMALYTFYSTAHAIVDMVKYRRFESPVMSSAKTVSLSGALVSVLNLETAMFAQFGGDMSLEGKQIFIILTGAGVSVVIVFLSVMLIGKATKAIRREKNGK